MAELLYWNRTVAHNQARTFRFLNKSYLCMFLFPWVYLVDSANIQNTFYYVKFGIPSIFT